MERAFPLRVLRYRLRRGNGGTGWAPGGEEALAERLADKCTIQFKAGDVLRMPTPGGGWGAASSISRTDSGSDRASAVPEEV